MSVIFKLFNGYDLNDGRGDLHCLNTAGKSSSEKVKLSLQVDDNLPVNATGDV